MDSNGASSTAPLADRVAELELALAVLARRLEELWQPRLLAVEAQLDQLAAVVEEYLPTKRGP